MHAEYQTFLVFTSILIAIFSSCIALTIIDGLEGLPERMRKLRIVLSSIAFATGVWSMHFIGMLAVKLPMPLAYSSGITLFSYLFSLAGAITAFALISRKNKTTLHQVIASAFLATAICSMHYSGMASMRMQPAIIYDTTWVFASIIIAFAASYVGLYIATLWQQNNKKNKLLFYTAGITLGFAVSAMHYSGMAAATFPMNSHSLAIEGGLMGEHLAYAIMSATLLVLLLLLFSSLRESKIILWKVLFIIAVSELTIMLSIPIIVPENTAEWVIALIDVCALVLLIFPIAWRVKVNAAELLMNKKNIEQNFEAQKSRNRLLSLPLREISMADFLNQALRIIQNTSYLRHLPQGAIFLSNAHEKTLTMQAEYNLDPEIKQQCAKVNYGQCLCGVAAEQLETQHQTHVTAQHSTRYTGMNDHGHYNMPLIFEDNLYGVLCLYLKAQQHISSSEKTILNSLAMTIAELIAHKQALDELQLAETVFDYNLTGLIITDANNKILNVNPSFTQVTGYTEAEVINRNPNILKSGKHDPNFYQAIWQSIAISNSWEGELWNRRKNGEIYPQWSSISAVRNKDGSIKNYIASFIDISERKKAEEQINQLAYYDSLTKLPNRSLFYDRLSQALLLAHRDKNRIALCFIDLDKFKNINDSFGHDAGDALLAGVAERASSCIRSSDTLARLGGDEFVIILPELQGDKQQSMLAVQQVVNNVIEQLSKPHDYKGQSLQGGASIGIALYPDHAQSSEQLLQLADNAMYEAKNAGRNQFRFTQHKS